MELPLYSPFTPGNIATAHPGLIFDKYPCLWEKDNRGNWSLPDGAKKTFYEQVFGVYRPNNLITSLNNALSRHRHLVKEVLNGEALEMKTDWRFVSGMGSGHPYETGFIWHRTLAVPYLPGSSVKGMIRAWAEQWQETDEVWKQTAHLFGKKEKNDQESPGSLIIFDALPTAVPALELDILNPHYKDYYEDPVKTPPADYLNPVPVFFITVAAGQRFLFSLAPRPGAHETSNAAAKDVKRGAELLEDALSTIGAGGKTAVGYGTMSSMKSVEDANNEKAIQWVYDTIAKLKDTSKLNDEDAKNLWKNPVAEEWESWKPPEMGMKQTALQEIKKKWQEFGFDWIHPTGKSAMNARRKFGN